MQNPGRAFHIESQPRTPSQRFTSVAIVGAIHIGAITALVLGLNTSIVQSIIPVVDFKVIPPKETKPVDLPVLPPVVLTRPSIPTVPKPTFDVSKDGGSTLTVTTGPSQTYERVASIGVSGIANTHSVPPYPPISRRLGHEGMVVLKLMISPQGAIIAVQIEGSSGYTELDDIAAQWVKAHWRYHPASVGGAPVASVAEASVRFSLKDAR